MRQTWLADPRFPLRLQKSRIPCGCRGVLADERSDSPSGAWGDLGVCVDQVIFFVHSSQPLPEEYSFGEGEVAPQILVFDADDTQGLVTFNEGLSGADRLLEPGSLCAAPPETCGGSTECWSSGATSISNGSFFAEIAHRTPRAHRWQLAIDDLKLECAYADLSQSA